MVASQAAAHVRCRDVRENVGDPQIAFVVFFFHRKAPAFDVVRARILHRQPEIEIVPLFLIFEKCEITFFH